MVYLVLVLTALVSSAISKRAVEQCPTYDTLDETVYLPHPYDCSLFRRCQAGQPILGHCPPGQHFNPATLACDEPARAGCTATPNICSAREPQSFCRYSCVCTRAEQMAVCPATLKFDAQLNVIDLTLDSACDRESSNFVLRGNKLGSMVVRNATATVSMCDQTMGAVDAPHFANCALAVRCENGTEEELECPTGYFYNHILGYCDEPEYVNCSTVGKLAAPAECLQDEALSKCHHKCTCHILKGGCPARLLFSTTTSIFDAVNNPACLKEPAVITLSDQYVATLNVHPNTTKVSHCPDSQQAAPLYFRDPYKCGAITLCHRSKERIIYCPKKMVFNPRRRRCVMPDPDICQDVVLPTTQPPGPAVALDDVVCPAASPCPAGGGRVPHLTDCTFFCQCRANAGPPVLGTCPSGLHFSKQLMTCVSPDNAGCKTWCRSLVASSGGSWSPANCVTERSDEGAQCRLQCNSDRQLLGSEVVQCTNKGWHGTGGLNIIPSCNTPEQVAVKIIGKINETLSRLQQVKADANFLFILDESGSISTSDFMIEKNFVSAIVNAFPLSQRRSAGVMTFSDNAAVDISLTERQTCNFLSRLENIVYSSGGTDIANALKVALSEINLNSRSTDTLVFLISDGQSQSDPVAAAQRLRSTQSTLFTVGVGGYDRKQLEPISSTHKDGSKLFFAIPNFRIFKVVADYLRTTFNKGATYQCP